MKFKFKTISYLLKQKFPNMTPERAGKIKYRISLIYTFVSWHIFGAIIYVWYKKEEKAVKNVEYLNPSPTYFKMTKAQNVHMVRMSGFEVVDSVEIDIKTPEGQAMKENYSQYLRTMKENRMPQVDFEEYQKRNMSSESNAESTVAIKDAQLM